MKLVLDVHTHTIASGHAYSTVLEYVMEAKSTGIELIAITDHAPAMPGSLGKAHFVNFKAVPQEVDGVKIMMGVELNIMDKTGRIDLDEEILNNINPVIASLHSVCYKYSRDEMCEEEKRYEVTQTIINVMENKCVQIIGHPGEPRYPLDVKKVVKKSLETGVMLEINCASLDETGFRRGSRMIMLDILNECKKEGCPIVVGSDAHFSKMSGKFGEAVKLLNEAGFPEQLVANTSVRRFNELLRPKSLSNIS